ncbi:MAG: FAD/NAD(P)-binding protein, partial [Acidobacteriota bacterium]
MSPSNPGAIVAIPEIAVIDEVKEEIEDVRTFYFSFENKEAGRNFRSKSGQFIMCTVFGAGEFAVSLPFSPEDDRRHISVRQVGKVTRALHELRAGDKIGIRGPFGNGFPFEAIKGKNVIYVAGGIGLIPLRSSIVHVLQHRQDFGRILLIYGSKSSKELMFRDMIAKWQATEGFETYITIDRAEPGWTGQVGFVHTLVGPAHVPVENTVAFVCGPPLMFNSVIKELLAAGLK